VLKKQGPRLTPRPGAAAVAASQREAAPGRSGCGEAATDPGGFGGDGRGGGGGCWPGVVRWGDG